MPETQPMTEQQAKQILDQIVGQVFGFQNPFTLEQFREKYAFDVHLPQPVTDATDGSQTWAQSINPSKFIKMSNARKRSEVDDWILPKRQVNSIEDMLAAWSEVNMTSTEREIQGLNIAQSDMVYECNNVWRCQDVHNSQNILFCDSGMHMEMVAASQRSNTSTYCIRLEDSKECANSFSISWSAKISNSFFLHDCYDVQDSIFCSHISGKRFCIANMQFTEEEYNRLKPMVIQWILTS